ncbi:MAG: NAD(P)-binding domain-containing protein [Ferruginibacter sp.]
MKIGILGSAAVGQTLAKAFKAEGYDTMIGTRDVSKEALVTFSKANSIALGTFEDTAHFGELLVICTKGSAAKLALNMAKVENLASKIIIDTTNPIAATAPENGVLHFTTSLDHSLMEELQQEFPNAKFVKAFNSVGNGAMYKPDYGGIKPSMFICGNDEAARQSVATILDAFGWETEDMGTATAARAIEPLCMLWCIPGFLRNQWTHAFKLLK